MSWQNDVRRANEALDWIEQRQGPLPADGYARIQTTVGQVRAMAEGQDDARVQEIRELLAEVNTPVGYFPDLNEALDWAFALAGRIDALTAERDALRAQLQTALSTALDQTRGLYVAATDSASHAERVEAERDALAARLELSEAVVRDGCSHHEAQQLAALAARLAAAEAALQTMVSVHCDPKCQSVGHFKPCYQARAALAGSREQAAGEGA